MLNSGSNNATQITPVPGSNHLPPDFGIAPGTGIFRSITMEEIWKPVAGYEGLYDVSNMGNVRSYVSIGRYGRIEKIPQRILTPVVRNKYYKVSLSKMGTKSVRLIHLLVLGAFISNRPDGMEANHKDNNRLNNRLDNLYWDTHKNNMINSKHMFRGHGKLTKDLVLEARRLRVSGCTYKKIGERCSMSPQGIYCAVNGLSWGWVS
jgi:hypothetical protein